MSGHSKWATIKHKKAATDAKRGQAFTRIIREITIAARIGGGDANSNPRLRTAILAGKNENMPNENIERAILRGTGQLEGEQYEEATFEGYGPGGVGMLIQVVTTNRNRVVGEFRHLMSTTLIVVAVVMRTSNDRWTSPDPDLCSAQEFRETAARLWRIIRCAF